MQYRDSVLKDYELKIKILTKHQ